MKFEYSSRQLTYLHRVTVWLAAVQTSAILHAIRNDRGTDWAASVVAQSVDDMPESDEDAEGEAIDIGHAADEYVRGQ